MTVADKLQQDFLKGKTLYYCDFGDYIFITNKYIGAYVNRKNLRINLENANKIRENIQKFRKENIIANGVEAKETDNAKRIDNKFYIKLLPKEEHYIAYAYVADEYLKLVRERRFRRKMLIKDYRSPVVILGYDGEPESILLPFSIYEQ